MKKKINECCRFVIVDVGDAGCHRDGGIFSNSSFGKALDTGILAIPDPQPLPSTTQPAVLLCLLVIKPSP